MIKIVKPNGTTPILRPSPTLLGLPSTVSGNALHNDNTITRPFEVIIGLLHICTKLILASVSKAGKSWLLLYLAICVATGMDFFSWRTRRGKVLYVNLEIQTPFIKERLRVLMARLGITDCGDLEFWNLRGKTGDPEALITSIIKYAAGKGFSVIIIDPYYKLMNGKSENTAGSAVKVCNLLEKVAEITGAAVVCSHHFTKGNGKNKTAMDRMSGSGVFARDADTIITLTNHTEPECYTVETILRNLPEQPPFVLQWDYPLMVEREDLQPEGLEDAGVDDGTDHGIMALLDAGPLRSGEWESQAIALGISRATFHRVKKALREGGHITFDRVTKTFSRVVSAVSVPPADPQTEPVAEPETVVPAVVRSQSTVTVPATAVRDELTARTTEKFNTL